MITYKLFTLFTRDVPLVMAMKPDDFTIDVPLVMYMEPDKRPKCCIYKVPQMLRKVNQDAYTPMLISIGPFHHGHRNLRKMEKLKVRYFEEAISRTKKSDKDLAKFIQENEVIIRQCYSEIIPISSESFVQMILLDSIFIIEHLWRTKQTWPKSCVSNDTSYSHKCEWKMGSCVFACQKEQGSPNDRGSQEKEYLYPWLSYNILQDLILLENQIPFFVLEELYNSSYRDLSDDQNKGCKDEDKSFLHLVIHYFLYFWQDSGLCCKKILSDKDKKQVRHFTDLLRYFLLPSERKCGKSIKRLPCATKLAEAGVEFREAKDKPLLDIQFHKNGLLEYFPCLNLSWLLSCFPCFKCLEKIQPVLKLRAFIVGDATERVIRNLMALEQYHYPREAYICNYIVLLDHLINTVEDVDLLVEKKVIVNWLGSNKIVANLINKQ